MQALNITPPRFPVVAVAGDAVGRAVVETDAAGGVVGAMGATVRRVPVRYLQKVWSRLRMWSPVTEKVVARVIAAAGTGGVVVTEIAIVTVTAIRAATVRRRHSAFFEILSAGLRLPKVRDRSSALHFSGPVKGPGKVCPMPRNDAGMPPLIAL